MGARQPLQLDRAMEQAWAYVRDNRKLSWLLRQAAWRGNKHKEFLADCWADLQTLLRLLRAWASGKRSLPPGTATMAAAALIYFVNPLDVIPDAIPVLGFLDDSSVVATVVGANSDAIRHFLVWERDSLRWNRKKPRG